MKKKLLLLVLLSTLSFNYGHARKLYVSIERGSNVNAGSQEMPFATISKAAALALAGDTIIIEGGTYRESVSPANGGVNPSRRITYMADEGAEVYLKGSEVVKEWKKLSKDVWQAEVSNDLFGDYNPYEINLFGDWLTIGQQFHLGEVYIDGKSIQEVESADETANVEGSWHAQVKDKTTLFTANFAGTNPNKALIEINARETCFFPKTTGVDYITVKGLNISQAAPQWAAPTSEQVGMIGPNWSKGWIIEDCEISNSKNVGLCIGKERASGHNKWSLYNDKGYGYIKHGFTHEIEAIIKAIDLGWSKENIGSHLIQNNKIHDCGQAGIVGHMGCAFSTIRGNEIYNINTMYEIINGWETAGIKLHAAIDSTIEGNCISNSTMGIWLDWQAQGTKVLNNIVIDSRLQDLFVEVSHGPTLVCNNILLSRLALHINAQGVAFAGNLFAGKIRMETSKERYTPYHVAHSTKLKGFFNSPGGDIRYFNNIFLANGGEGVGINGLTKYNDYPEYTPVSCTSNQTGDYLTYKFPMWVSNNVYFNGGEMYINEKNSTEYKDKKVKISLEKEEDGTYYLTCDVDFALLENLATLPITTESLPQTIISELQFENADQTPFALDFDYFGATRDVASPTVGPFENKIEKRMKIWSLK